MTEKLFTAGPVAMYPGTLQVGGTQTPYFRTEEFSQIVLDSERRMCSLAGAPPGSRTMLLACSGSGAMEAAVLNAVGSADRALIVVGGAFGQRFCDICDAHGIAWDAVRLPPGRALSPDQIDALPLDRYGALLVNAHETSTGLLYDLHRLGNACRRAGVFFVVDAISSFLCDSIHMETMAIDILITSSQKALALAPGLSMLVLGPRAVARARALHVASHYFALSRYLDDGARGQTPFTPAVSIILQLHQRLVSIEEAGVQRETDRCARLAHHFRSSIRRLPLRVFPEVPSSALTALQPVGERSALGIYSSLRSQFGLVVTPSGGELTHTLFRVGHMGNITEGDLDLVANALQEIMQ